MASNGKGARGWRAARDLLVEAVTRFGVDEGTRRGAALAFFSIFSLSPLFLVVLAISSLWFGRNQARDEVFAQVAALAGERTAEAVRALVSKPQPVESARAAAVALGTLFVGATAVFVEMQASLNVIWRVRPLPGRGLVRLVMARLISFAVVLTIGFLLLSSVALSAALAAFARWLGPDMPGIGLLMNGADILLSLGVTTLLFALIFRLLPDAAIRWRDVGAGALLTALLFTAGKAGIGVYLGRAGVVSAYGAAGSLVAVLLWIYYSAQIFFFGAEVTALYAKRFGSNPVAARGYEISES